MKRFAVIFIFLGVMFQVFPQGKETNEADTMKYYELLRSYDAESQINFSLMTASANGNSYIVRWLIDHGADVEASTNEDVRALHFAAGNNRTEVVKILLESGADPDILSNYSETPLHIAAKKNYIQVAELLARYGADVNMTDRFGATPLHYASAYGFFELADLLLYYDAAVYVKDYDGTTPLMAAIWAGNANIADLLMQHGANPSDKDDNGFTPLMIAAQNGDTLVMDLLIRRFVNIYEKNNYNYDALDLATKSDHAEAVKYLLRKGDKWVNNGNNAVNPYSVALSYGRNEMAELLADNGITPVTIKGFNQVSLYAGTRAVFHDYSAGFAMHLANFSGKSGILMGYDFKPGYTRVLMKKAEDLYYQYLDKSSLAYAGYFLNIPVTDNITGGNWNLGFSLSAGWYMPDKLKGTYLAPGKNLKIIPAAGINRTNDKLTIRAEFEYIKTPFYRVGPVWLRISAGYNIYFNRLRAPGKIIKWY
ncbi:MAG TPA: ankyrin repeat domain-containing protein [Bacteroidales bacterium]|nr:ankyrin repeat domain-containing protein [Bacteroidales bacterium]